jgi:ankyrin repeat protein
MPRTPTQAAASDRFGRNTLHYAAAEDQIEEVTQALKRGVDPNCQDKDGWTPLHFAAQAQSARVIRSLLAAGAAVDVRDSNGNNALFRAVFSYKGDSAAIVALKEAGADPNSVNNHGVSAVGLARTIANTGVSSLFSDVTAAQ